VSATGSVFSTFFFSSFFGYDKRWTSFNSTKSEGLCAFIRALRLTSFLASVPLSEGGRITY
jgi:hypothetical protein